jgi:hypothetical protein
MLTELRAVNVRTAENGKLKMLANTGVIGLHEVGKWSMENG